MSPPRESERMMILEMVETGHITPEEGVALLEALRNDQAGERQAQASLTPDEPASTSDDTSMDSSSEAASEGRGSNPAIAPPLHKWRNWWTVPLGVGAVLTIAGGLLINQAYRAGGASLWFYCAWVPALLGLGIMALAWASRGARWLHIRIRNRSGAGSERMAISFPLPLRATAWFVRTFGSFIPQLERSGVDELVLALEHNATPENPLYIQVEEDEDGEQVEVYLG